MKKTIIYGRVSTTDQENSQEVQEIKCREYCRLYDLTVVQCIIESGISGKTELFKRPGGKKIKDSIESKEGITDIVVYKLDRMARNVIDSLTSMQYFKDKKIAVHFVSYGGTSLNTNSAIGSFLLTTLSAVAELERNMIADRTRDALQSLKRVGKRHSGQIPIGVKVEKTQVGIRDGISIYEQKFIPDPEFASSIAIIMDNKHESLRFIQSILPKKIGLNTINRIIKNER